MSQVMTAAGALLLLFDALGSVDLLPGAEISGLILLLIFSVTAYLLLKRDRTPAAGTVFFTGAVLTTSVQALGGADGPAALLYPVLFLWMKRSSISGPVLLSASSMALTEFLAPMSSAAGIPSGTFEPGGILAALNTALVAGVVPLASLFLVEFLEERRSEPLVVPDPTEDRLSPEPGFPEDVSRSLIPVLRHGTEAGGIFLFTRDPRGVMILNEHDVTSGDVSSRYMSGPDDSMIKLLDESAETVIRTEARRFSADGGTGLPWYTSDPGREWVLMTGFRRNGIVHGVLILDFQSGEAARSAAPLLVEANYLLSVTWERNRQSGRDGFLAICEDMSDIPDVKGAVHRLVTRILRTWEGTTASVAILGEGGVLRIFESLGPLSEGRAGREFGLREGFAGLAVMRKEPVRRLRMRVGRTGRTFGETDQSGADAGSCCAVPLEDRGTVIGVLTVESMMEQFFTPEDLFLLSSFATVFSLAVGRRNLQDRMAMMKKNDRLTGLPLLSTFHEMLADLVRVVRSRAWSITVLAVDINGFSRINETYGYPAGDVILEKAAGRLRRSLGKEAVLARSGPDSFLVCLQEVDRISAEAFAARIHEGFADVPFRISEREVEVSVSIGGAVSHVDRMIPRLPGIAVSILKGVSGRQGFTSITEVTMFYEIDRKRK